jgi:hypothetical protein
VFLAAARSTRNNAAQGGANPQPFDGTDIDLHLPRTTTTDAAGRYRFASLPTNFYDLWVEAEGWQYPGYGSVAQGGQTIDAPDMVVTKGGTVRVRLIDDVTAIYPLTATSRRTVLTDGASLDP